MKAMITRKIGMTSIITEDGAMVAVTLLSASPNTVTHVKTVDSDGYQAIQLGFEESKKIGKAQAGHFKKAGEDVAPKVVKEFRTTDNGDLKAGSVITLDEAFEVGDLVDVTGISKGKGFAGTIKRHNFSTGRKTHGGRSYRRPGSIGSMYPQKVFKGKRMAGQMGAKQITMEHLKIALLDTELNIIGVTGAVPGPKKSIVLLRTALRGGK